MRRRMKDASRRSTAIVTNIRMTGVAVLEKEVEYVQTDDLLAASDHRQ